MLEIILFILVCFICNIVQAITGFAGTVLAMPFSLRLVGADTAKPILNLVALGICLVIAITKWRSIKVKELLIMLGFLAVGFCIGILLEHFFPNISDSKIVLRIYGGIICLLAIFFFIFKSDKYQIPTVVLYILLILGGILHRLFISGGPLVVIYTSAKLKEKDEFRATLSAVWVILNAEMFVEHLVKGLFTSNTWMIFGIVAGVSIVSFIIGKFIAKKISLPVFMKVTYVLLFVSGLSILI